MITRLQQDEAEIRTMLSRSGLGATAGIVQKRELRFDRLTIDRASLIVVRKGWKEIHSPGGTWTVRQGEAVVIAAGRTLDVINHPGQDGCYEARWLVWDDGVLNQYCPDPMISPVRWAAVLTGLAQPFLMAFDRALEAISQERTIPETIARHRLGEMLLWLGTQGIAVAASDVRSTTDQLRYLLGANPDHAWSSGEAARHLAVSEATLRRRLSAEGQKFSDLLVDVRMSWALALLQSTDQPVSRIALDVGYESSSRFAVRFRKRFGFSPSAVRGHGKNGAVATVRS